MKLILFLLAISWSIASPAESTPFYAMLETDLYKKQSLPFTGEIQYELVSDKPDKFVDGLVNWSGITATKLGEERVLVKQRPRPEFVGPLVDDYVASSFVVDFDEKSVVDFVSGFAVDKDEKVSLEKITAYVSQYIDSPTYIHGFNIASVVARNRSGDCTEFAVLTAALARSLSLPARIVFGTAIVNTVDSVNTYGHAWTEIRHDGKWQIADAALYPLSGVEVYYTPGAALENEGLGYAMSLASAVQVLPSRIEALRDKQP